MDALDGERVVVGYFDRDPHAPVILGSLPHPRSRRRHDAPGGALADPTTSQSLDAAPDGNERWVGHQGTVVRVDRVGNVRIDTVGAGVANDGETDDSEDASVGHVDINLKTGASFVVRVAGVPVFRLRADGDGEVELDIGAGDQRVVLGDRFQAVFDAHTHPEAGAPPAQTMAAAQLDPATATLSDRLRVAP